MPGRMPRERPRGTGPHPDWSDVAWWVYDDVVTIEGRERHYYRVSPRELSKGEVRRFETHAATVRRCSLRTVRMLLNRGVPPRFLQAAVDGFADAQAARVPVEPNAYRDLIDRIREEARRMKDRPAEEPAKEPEPVKEAA